MPGIRSKKSKVKVGLQPGYTPKLLREPTEEAQVPLWQPDGSVRYVTDEDLKWLIDNKKVDLPKPTGTLKEDSRPSSG